MKIAILYICTGKYAQFFEGFYSSAEKYFLKEIAKLDYFVFTDQVKLTESSNVHLIYQECKGFPLDSLFRFEMFLKIQDQLKKYDYIFFFNANTEFKQKIGIEILPISKEEPLIAAQWPINSKLMKLPCFFPYERNKKSLAYIPPFEKKTYKYYMGGLNGGISKDYLNMIQLLADNIRTDYNNNIIAKVHDESHINKYFRNHNCKVLGPEYSWPEEWKSNIKPKIIFRDKIKISKYFIKGRNISFFGKIKIKLSIIKNALSWYI